MSEANESRQMSIYMTPEVWEKVQEVKRVYFDRTYGDVLRMMLVAGAEKLKAENGAGGSE